VHASGRRGASATAEESASKCEAETKANPEIHGQDSLEPTHGRPRCIENGDSSERVLGAGRGGGFFTGEPFFTIFTLPLFTWIQFFVFFLPGATFRQNVKKKEKKILSQFSHFLLEKNRQFWGKKKIDKKIQHIWIWIWILLLAIYIS
jgi:hypothetical protein